MVSEVMDRAFLKNNSLKENLHSKETLGKTSFLQ